MIRPRLARFILTLTCAAGAHAEPFPAAPPTPRAELVYEEPFFPGAIYDKAIPTPESLLGFEVGQRGSTHAQIEKCLKAWADAAPTRTRLVEYARTHENRACYYLVISSESNIRDLGDLKKNLAKLADPRTTTAAEADQLASTIPGVAWLAYNIHGDENSPSDTAIALAYHLLADTRDETKALLNDLVVVIDPLQNPDGRDRFLKMVAEHRGNVRNTDDQSLLHTGYYPQGRTNHYQFDLNRDWVYATQPETRGRIAALREWTPLLFCDGHELSPQDTYLFSPPREPINFNIPETTRKRWGDKFAEDQAAAFDKFGWRYYTGEWADNWFPGYSDAYASYRGAIGILTEQARIQEDGVRKQNQIVETYRETVHHNIVSSVANLTTLKNNLRDIYKDYLAARRAAVDEKSRYGTRAWAIAPTDNTSRLNRLIETLRLHGVEVFETNAEFTSEAKDQLGRTIAEQKFPGGTILIPNRQPEAHLLAAMLEFDPRMLDETLTEERRELLRFGRSKMYDLTAWNLTMLYGVEAYELPDATGARYDKDPIVEQRREGGLVGDIGGQQSTWLAIPGDDDSAVQVASRLMEHGINVRLLTRDSEFDGIALSRGTLCVFVADNPQLTKKSLPPSDRATKDGDPGALNELENLVAGAATAGAIRMRSGLAPGDLPDIGGEFFPLLERPRIAVLARGSLDYYDYGSVWWTLDHHLGIQASYLAEDDVAPNADLRRYNVIVIPNRWAGALPDSLIANLKPWIQNGGTLIAMGSAAAALAAEKPGLSQVRQLPDVLTKLEPYALQIIREWEGRTQTADIASAWLNAPTKDITYPWSPALSAEKPSDDERKRRDLWQGVFMPTGAILAARFDDKHWLTFGCNDARGWLPVPFGSNPILMTADNVETPVRLGAFLPSSPSPSGGGSASLRAGERDTGDAASPIATADTKPRATDANDNNKTNEAKDESKAEEKKPSPTMIGWAPVPEGHDLYLRMSGLLWPEAAHRVANAAYVTRERVGRGQIILFASPPTTRGSQPGVARLFLNAVIFGPGLGASHPIDP